VNPGIHALVLGLGVTFAPLAAAESQTDLPAGPTPDAQLSPVAADAGLRAPSPEPSQTGAASGIGTITGRVFAHLRVPTGDPLGAPIQQASTSAWIQARPRFSEAASATITLTADAIQSALDPTTHLRASVREAYVEALKGGFELRVGQQIIPWGNADGVNPTDFLTAKDLTFFSADPEVRRFGALSARAAFTPNGGSSPLALTVVATPVFPSSRLLVPSGLFPAGVTSVGFVRPPVTLENTELAARAAFTAAGWDAALVVFRGFNHTPQFFLVSHDATSTVVGQTNRHQSAVGAEGSVTLGAWVLRVEGAYAVPDNPGRDPRMQPAHLDVVSGVERSFWERLRVQLQGIVRVHGASAAGSRPGPDPVRDAIDQGIGDANALLLDYQDEVRPAASLRVAYATEDDTFEAEVVGYVNLRRDPLARSDYLLRPMLTYRFRDPLKLLVGVEYFGGPSATPLGALHPFSGAFVEAAYTF
jgi:hypothetical protein